MKVVVAAVERGRRVGGRHQGEGREEASQQEREEGAGDHGCEESKAVRVDRLAGGGAGSALR